MTTTITQENLEMYSDAQKKAARIVSVENSNIFDFPHDIENYQIVLEYCAATNPKLKIQPIATEDHKSKWNEENNIDTDNLANTWQALIEKDSYIIKELYIYAGY